MAKPRYQLPAADAICRPAAQAVALTAVACFGAVVALSLAASQPAAEEVVGSIERNLPELNRFLITGGVVHAALALGLSRGQLWGWGGAALVQIFVVGAAVRGLLHDPQLGWVFPLVIGLLVLAALFTRELTAYFVQGKPPIIRRAPDWHPANDEWRGIPTVRDDYPEGSVDLSETTSASAARRLRKRTDFFGHDE